MKKEAGQSAEQMFLIEGDHQSADAVQQALKRGVDPQVGELLLRQDQELSRKGYRSPIHLAWDYAVLQRKGETVRALQDSFREHSPFLVFLEEEPVYDFLHSDPRYRAPVAKMGLPALAPFSPALLTSERARLATLASFAEAILNEFYKKGCQENTSPSTGGQEDFCLEIQPTDCKCPSIALEGVSFRSSGYTTVC